VSCRYLTFLQIYIRLEMISELFFALGL